MESMTPTKEQRQAFEDNTWIAFALNQLLEQNQYNPEQQEDQVYSCVSFFKNKISSELASREAAAAYAGAMSVVNAVEEIGARYRLPLDRAEVTDCRNTLVSVAKKAADNLKPKV